MPHVLEPAASGRSKCRGCAQRIASGELRFGERLPNPFADGEMTLWFHPTCAAFKRPEPFLELAGSRAAPEVSQELVAAAERGLAHRRLPRIDGAERSPTGRATCRSCREPIAKDAWRIRLVFFEEGQFAAGGFIHAACAAPYFETTDIVPRLRHFSPALTAADLSALQSALTPPDAS